MKAWARPAARAAWVQGGGPLALVALAGWGHAAALAWPWPWTLAPWLRPGQPVAWLHGLSLALLVWALARAPSATAAAARAAVYATAWLAGTFWWLFVSMHTYGGLAAPLAAAAVLALAAFLALDYAVAAGLWWRWRAAAPVARVLAFAALWTLAELARGVLWTGFPWGAGGYAQIDALGWLAPWVGVYGMGAVAAALAAALAVGGQRGRVAAAGLALAVWAVPGSGAWLAERLPDPTQPAGTLPVRLLQGAIAQDLKFDPEAGVPLALGWYGQALVRASADPALAGGLVVAPETAIPLLPQDIDADYWRALAQAVRAGRVAVLLGVPLGSFERGYTNSVVGWRPPPSGEAAPSEPDADPFGALSVYRYDKQHLVPFGEFIPPGFRWFTDLMHIPLGDFARGALPQPPFEWAGQRIAPHVCYEDLFGEELAAGFRDADRAPTVLVNVSNVAWFGDTVAIDQHRHISRLRALELGRPLVRATNTGATAAIDHRGRVVAELPRWQRGALDATVQPRTGMTPYAAWVSRWGLWPLAGVCLALLVWLRPRRSHRRLAR
ncbi:Apolipoprotein N-acyltransferase [Tepidimonas thermarum]|uniref:Apolipoprotein N-acyltransferase n=1 Tax=Tepidimonas thermarum TaxID=335431 RepID=A0A554X4H9_9BURK|nr:apolipoprotein N-acyltransferase [Tepidimonas thermarum]TSE30751.1 Apolipoprotein N-acyltransferase [Tepidimonas thermarum]